MTCLNPVRAYFGPGAVGWHETPSTPDSGYLPCNRCAGCRARQAMDWATRCWCESRLHDQNAFVTLTYRDAPPEIVRRDLTLFFKRLRSSGVKFRYFASAERGALYGRPHFHVLFFGVDFLTLKDRKALDAAWPHGFIDVGDVSTASVNYVAGYTAKKLADDTADGWITMSRAPGIGYDWLRLHRFDLERTGTVVIEGKEYPIPDFFLERSASLFRHVKKDRASYAVANQKSDTALRARAVKLEQKRREKVLGGRT